MFMAVSLLIFLGLAVFFLARLFVLQDRLIFRPGPLLDRPADLWNPYEDVLLAGPDGSPIAATWITTPESDGAVVFLHGSDGNVTHELGAIWFLRSLRLNALLVEYPGYAYPGLDLVRARPSEAGCYRAAEAAWRFIIDEKGFAPQRVIVFGHSLGGAVAAYLAGGRTCRGLVIQSGFTSVPDLAARAYPHLPVRPFCRTRLNTLEMIAHCACPVIVVHSEDDEHIPVEQARRLYERAPSAKRLVITRGSHFSRAWQRSPEIRQAWLELLSDQTACWDRGERG